ncbi:hypothetical protein H5410_045925 [Solanum commersonii]|uniref:Transmembrane protein n=1 Tax=Solanum commersonii TaxID=4109 RepID=A0A9J5XAW3_SOLCO|nr:hypothetical protein H5410_045925 [Solanum commersonii]
MRLVKRIKELEEVLTFYESRVEIIKWVKKVKKKKKKKNKRKCFNLKLIVVLIVVVFFIFLSITENAKDRRCGCVQSKLA